MKYSQRVAKMRTRIKHKLRRHGIRVNPEITTRELIQLSIQLKILTNCKRENYDNQASTN